MEQCADAPYQDARKKGEEEPAQKDKKTLGKVADVMGKVFDYHKGSFPFMVLF